MNAIQRVCEALQKPVNVVMGLAGSTFTVDELAAVGVRRISLGSSLARAALGEFIRAALEVKTMGTFNFASNAISFQEANSLMAPARKSD